MVQFVLALRYLRKRRITLFALLSVILGAMAFIVVMGVMDGYSLEFNNRSRNLLGDLVVSIPNYAIPDADLDVRRILRVRGVEAAAANVRDYGVLKIPQAPSSGGSFAIEWCLIVGVDPAAEFRVVRPVLEPNIAPADFPQPKGDALPDWIILGSDLMQAHSLKVGDKVWLVTSRQSGLDRVRVKRELTVIGSLSFGLSDADREVAYVDRRLAASMRQDQPGSASEIRVRLKPGVAPEAGARAVAAILGPDEDTRQYYSVLTFKQTSNMFKAIESQRSLSRFILFFLFLVSGLAVVAVLFLIVLEKRHDIGVLRSLGLSSRGVAATFLAYAGVVAVVGASVGCLAGWALLSRLDAIRVFVKAHTGFDLFPSDLYHLDRVPWVVDPANPILIFVAALVVSLLAGIVPALWAAKLDPMESLRSD